MLPSLQVASLSPYLAHTRLLKYRGGASASGIDFVGRCFSRRPGFDCQEFSTTKKGAPDVAERRSLRLIAALKRTGHNYGSYVLPTPQPSTNAPQWRDQSVWFINLTVPTAAGPQPTHDLWPRGVACDAPRSKNGAALQTPVGADRLSWTPRRASPTAVAAPRAAAAATSRPLRSSR